MTTDALALLADLQISGPRRNDGGCVDASGWCSDELSQPLIPVTPAQAGVQDLNL